MQCMSWACRYNLLREESEGFAKLVTLLGHLGAGDIAADTALAEVLTPLHSCSVTYHGIMTNGRLGCYR